MTPLGPDSAVVRDEITREITAVHEESYGAGFTDITVELGEDLVVLVLDVELATSERTLLDADRGDAVKDMREAYQAAIESTFTAVIERATGRKVSSFLSAMSMEPLYAVEVFRLEPANSLRA
jgi:uncharacterized protein YbcI